MNEISKIDRQIPIKAIPEQELNQIILTSFLTWVANLLNLNGEKSANGLTTALPAIKQHCWSMGFAEIKTMFEMYADNKLSIEPIPNYFDRILLGKIAKAYREQKQVKPKEIDHAKIMELTNKKHLQDFFSQYFDNKIINECYIEFVYSWLEQNKFLELTKEQKQKLIKDAEVMMVLEKTEAEPLKAKLKEFNPKDFKQDEKVFTAKKMAVRDFLRKLTVEQAKQIEEKLR